MPRKSFIAIPDINYHITARSVGRQPFKVILSDVWALFEDYLFLCSVGFGLRIKSFVLMPNHFHMIVSFADGGSIPEAMRYLLREASKELNRKTGNINQNFGGPYHWSLLSDYRYLLCAYKYVYRNPVHAKLVHKVEDYRFSTIRGLLGLDRLVIPVAADEELVNSTETHLVWLNSSYKSDRNQSLVRAALKRNEFQFPKETKHGPVPAGIDFLNL